MAHSQRSGALYFALERAERKKQFNSRHEDQSFPRVGEAVPHFATRKRPASLNSLYIPLLCYLRSCLSLENVVKWRNCGVWTARPARLARLLI